MPRPLLLIGHNMHAFQKRLAFQGPGGIQSPDTHDLVGKQQLADCHLIQRWNAISQHGLKLLMPGKKPMPRVGSIFVTG